MKNLVLMGLFLMSTQSFASTFYSCLGVDMHQSDNYYFFVNQADNGKTYAVAEIDGFWSDKLSDVIKLGNTGKTRFESNEAQIYVDVNLTDGSWDADNIEIQLGDEFIADWSCMEMDYDEFSDEIMNVDFDTDSLYELLEM